MPESWKNEVKSEPAISINAKWWENYKSPELNSLITKALENNKDLEAGIARIEQARASAKIAGAGLYPGIGASGNASKTYTDSRGSGDRESYGGSLDVSYELDLFGRNRSGSDAAIMREKATIYDHDSLALVITSDVAAYYAQYLTLNDRLAVAENNLANGQAILKIVQARFDAGKISALELAQQKTSLASLETIISGLKNQRNIAQSQIAILTGAAPQNLKVEGTTITSLSAPSINPLLPGELLERRPDIKAAEAELVAANMDIGAAKAEFLPKLQLGINPAATAASFSDPVSLATAFIASLTQPIFTGGALEGNLERTEARKKELAANYAAKVLNSLKEVEDALSQVNSAEESLVSDTTARDESQKAYDIATLRYKEGRIDFQTLLDTQSSLYRTQDSYYQSLANKITAAISLYKSLGGGWGES